MSTLSIQAAARDAAAAKAKPKKKTKAKRDVAGCFINIAVDTADLRTPSF